MSLSAQYRDDILGLRERGLTFRAIAAKLGVTTYIVAGVVRRERVKQQRRSGPPAKLSAADEMSDDELLRLLKYRDATPPVPWTRIAEMFGRPMEVMMATYEHVTREYEASEKNSGGRQ